MSLNVEGVIRSYLQGALGVQCVVEVPESRPTRFIDLERTAGARGSSIDDHPELTLHAWGTSRSDARALCDAMDDAMLSLNHTPIKGVARVDAESTCVHYPDYESGCERYQSSYSLMTYSY